MTGGMRPAKRDFVRLDDRSKWDLIIALIDKDIKADAEIEKLRATLLAWMSLPCQYCGDARIVHPVIGSCEGDMPATLGGVL